MVNLSDATWLMVGRKTGDRCYDTGRRVGSLPYETTQPRTALH